jgi:DNA (cytosine-5)-methyltransferase 1
MVRKDTVIDLFAGCGGLSLGLYEAGWQGIFAVEKNPCAFQTLDYNLIKGKCHFVWPEWLPQTPLDIIEVNNRYSEQLETLRGKVGLVAGGPPCQGFSMAGKRIKDDLRNQLLFENVKGFTYAFNKDKNPNAVPYSQLVIQKLHNLGYDVSSQVIDFSRYGVPQRRKRFILVGIHQGSPLAKSISS